MSMNRAATANYHESRASCSRPPSWQWRRGQVARSRVPERLEVEVCRLSGWALYYLHDGGEHECTGALSAGQRVSARAAVWSAQTVLLNQAFAAAPPSRGAPPMISPLRCPTMTSAPPKASVVSLSSVPRSVSSSSVPRTGSRSCRSHHRRPKFCPRSSRRWRASPTALRTSRRPRSPSREGYQYPLRADPARLQIITLGEASCLAVGKVCVTRSKRYAKVILPSPPVRIRFTVRR